MSLSSKITQIEEKLKQLERSIPGIEASALVSIDGLMLASALPPGVSEDKIAAMSAALLSISERINEELDRGNFEMGLVIGEKGFVCVMGVTPEALLVTLTSKDVRLGLLLYEMRRIASTIKELLTK